MAQDTGQPGQPARSATQVDGQRTLKPLYDVLARVLRTGALTSVVLVGVGLLVLLLDTAHRRSPGHTALFASPGAGIASLGLIVLVATPIVREITVCVGFARLGDRRFAGLSAAVLCLLGCAIVIGML